MNIRWEDTSRNFPKCLLQEAPPLRTPEQARADVEREKVRRAPRVPA